MSKDKKIFIELGVVLILVIFGFLLLTKNSAPVVTDNTANNQQVIPTEDLSVGSINVGAPAASIAYADALIKYKDARLQLDVNCQASPDKMTFKNNALMMVDNRAPVARTVHLGAVFPIKAYGFKIVKLSSTTLPVTWKVDCDSSQNVSTILIEK